MSYPPLPSNGETNWGTKFRTWANAIQGRKAEGAGMTVRVEYSPGKRIFIDSPGDSTMIYGDTGWRDILSLLGSTWERTTAGGQFQIKRQNDLVTLAVRIRRTEDATPRWPGVVWGLLNTEDSRLPSGFAPHPTYGAYAVVPVLSKYTGKLVSYTYGDELKIRATSVPNDVLWEAGDVLSFQTSWTTRQAWPSVLPGVPA